MLRYAIVEILIHDDHGPADLNLLNQNNRLLISIVSIIYRRVSRGGAQGAWPPPLEIKKQTKKKKKKKGHQSKY